MRAHYQRCPHAHWSPVCRRRWELQVGYITGMVRRRCIYMYINTNTSHKKDFHKHTNPATKSGDKLRAWSLKREPRKQNGTRLHIWNSTTTKSTAGTTDTRHKLRPSNVISLCLQKDFNHDISKAGTIVPPSRLRLGP